MVMIGLGIGIGALAVAGVVIYAFVRIMSKDRMP